MSDENIGTTPDLRSTLEQAFEEHTKEVATPEVQETTEVETKADRARDEQGRFAKGETLSLKKERDPVAKAPEAVTEAPKEEKPRPQRPSSWRKEYWGHWDQLDPNLAEYLLQREQEYAKGVSTYKTEAEKAKQLWSAIEPFSPVLQQHGISPDRWISQLGNAHMRLVYGSPEEKRVLFEQLARDYGVDLGQQPQITPEANELNYLKQVVSNLYYQQQDLLTRQQREAQSQIESEIQKFVGDTENYPYFEQVRETMAQLLESGVAPSLADAYSKAVRLHDDIFAEQQQKQLQAKQEAEMREKEARLSKAKAAAVSLKSSSPTGETRSANSKKGDLRSALSDAFDTVTAGRV